MRCKNILLLCWAISFASCQSINDLIDDGEDWRADTRGCVRTKENFDVLYRKIPGRLKTKESILKIFGEPDDTDTTSGGTIGFQTSYVIGRHCTLPDSIIQDICWITISFDTLGKVTDVGEECN